MMVVLVLLIARRRRRPQTTVCELHVRGLLVDFSCLHCKWSEGLGGGRIWCVRELAFAAPFVPGCCSEL